MAQAFMIMNAEYFTLKFDESWFPDPNSVDGLLKRLEMGEAVHIKILKEACEKEGRVFKIEFEK
jgi:hypothetical protein